MTKQIVIKFSAHKVFLK